MRLAAAVTVATVAGHPAAAQAPRSADPAAQGGDNPTSLLARGPNPLVAEVDGHPIHLGEVGDAIRALPGGGGRNSFEVLYQVVLRRLIERQALLNKARAEGVADDAVVQRHMQEAADLVLENEYLHRAIAARITEPELLARYEAEIRGRPGPEEVHARAILVATETDAIEAIRKLAGGADFAALARQVSKDGSAGSGGDLGFVRRGTVNADLAAVIFELRPGEVTPFPLRTPAGWFVLKSEERRRAPAPGFAEARDGLVEEILQESVVPIMQDALRRAVVRVYNMNGKEVSSDAAGDDAPATAETGR